jgi:hypothetical protein
MLTLYRNNRIHLSGYEHIPIGIHSEIYNVGLVMCSLTQGADRERLTPTNPRFPPDYDACYSARLEGLITECLQDDPGRRPTLPMLLAQIGAGLKTWEKIYGSANKLEDDLPEFMRLDAWKEEEHPIGSEAPEEWGGPRKDHRGQHLEAEEKIAVPSDTLFHESAGSKKRKAKALEQTREKVAAWMLTLPTDIKRPKKKLRTGSHSTIAWSESSTGTLVDPPPLRDMYILHWYKGDAMFKSDSSSDDDEKFGFVFRRRSTFTLLAEQEIRSAQNTADAEDRA